MKLTREVCFAIVFFCLFMPEAHALLKQVLGAAILGDVIPAFYSIKCVSSVKNFTHFMLYSRIHPDDPRPLVPNDWNLLQKSDFLSLLPTKIIIHGFVDNLRLSNWMTKMKNMLLREGDYNVIIVDWSCGNGFPYTQAVKNSKIAAQKVGDLISFLQDARQTHPSDFHLIGHSLGAQISAVVGHRIPGIGRISALDPAGPKFYNSAPEMKLDASDANFVDVIHTDGGSSLLEGLGLHEQVGHVDFYPNGGKTQPGCHSSPFAVLPRIGLQRAARYYLTCDHFRAIDYYIESIGATKKRDLESSCIYVSVQCKDWETFLRAECADCTNPGKCAFMGYHSDKHASSVEESTGFYLKTSEAEPYCVHHYQVVIERDLGGSGYASREDISDLFATATIHVEIKTGSGKTLTLAFSERSRTVLTSLERYIFLATSKYPLSNDIQEATMWWGSEEKPTYSATDDAPLLSLRSMEIIPVTLSTDLRARSAKVKKSLLCGVEKLSNKGYVFLTASNC